MMEDTKPTPLQTSPTFTGIPCLFCPDAPARELFPARLDPTKLDPYAFSARRQRKREHYRTVICENCGLVRSDPILSEEVINHLYEKSEFLFSEEAPCAADTYANLLQKLMHTCPNASHIDSMCEIGCSTGFFMHRCLKMGIQNVLGFEPSVQCRDQADAAVRNRIIVAPFAPNLAGDRRFDLVCGFHVFDHLRDPLKALTEACTLLKPHGFILLVCHDVASLGVRLLGSFNPIFDIEHIYLFSLRTMATLFDQCGLEMIKSGPLTNTYPLRYWMRMAPGVSNISRILPERVARMPISIQAGNLYAFGQKKEVCNAD
ncbi:MAG: class I SAM-dependent methyltransferase [Magnetococcus sp. DMHC-1]